MKKYDEESEKATDDVEEKSTWATVLQWVFAVALIGIAAFLWGPGIYRAVRHNPWLTLVILISVFLTAGFKNTIISWFSGGVSAVTNGARGVYPGAKQFLAGHAKRWAKPWPEKFNKYPRWEDPNKEEEGKP